MKLQQQPQLAKSIGAKQKCNNLYELSTFRNFSDQAARELFREFGRSQQAEGMGEPDVVVVAERPLQSSVHFAGGRSGGRTI